MTDRFPGAIADREAAEYLLVGAPLDRTTTFQPGTRTGPDRLRRFARSFEDYDQATGQRFSNLDVADHGNVEPFDDQSTYLGYLEGILAEAARKGRTPLVLGGEHTVAVAAIRALDPDIVVSVDAHLDLRESYHGTTLNHACAMARAIEVAEELYVVGARAGSEPEWTRAAESDVTVVPPEAAADWTVPQFDGRTYLSVDIDAVDPGAAPGTGTMEPFGLTPRTVRSIVRAIAPQAAGMDLVEVNDRDDGQTAALGAKLLRRFVYDHAAE